MERQYIPVPNSRFENALDKDRLLRVMEQVWAMHMERVTGIPHTVKMRLVPVEAPSRQGARVP